MSYTTYQETITVKEGNYGYDLEFQIIDEKTKQAADISGVSEVRLIVGRKGDSAAKFIGTCKVTDDDNGLISYNVQNGDFDVADVTYDAEIDLIYPDAVITAWGLKIAVASRLSRSTS